MEIPTRLSGDDSPTYDPEMAAKLANVFTNIIEKRGVSAAFSDFLRILNGYARSIRGSMGKKMLDLTVMRINSTIAGWEKASEDRQTTEIPTEKLTEYDNLLGSIATNVRLASGGPTLVFVGEAGPKNSRGEGTGAVLALSTDGKVDTSPDALFYHHNRDPLHKVKPLSETPYDEDFFASNPELAPTSGGGAKTGNAGLVAALAAGVAAFLMFK